MVPGWARAALHTCGWAVGLKAGGPRAIGHNGASLGVRPAVGALSAIYGLMPGWAWPVERGGAPQLDTTANTVASANGPTCTAGPQQVCGHPDACGTSLRLTLPKPQMFGLSQLFRPFAHAARPFARRSACRAMTTVKTMGAIEIEIHLLDLFVVFAQVFFAKNGLHLPFVMRNRLCGCAISWTYLGPFKTSTCDILFVKV